MYPEILSIGRFTVRSWGLFAAIAFAFGLFFGMRRAPKFNIDKDIVPDMLLVILISSMLGSRLFYVVFHLDEFKGRWLATINPFGQSGSFGLAGLSMMGGVVLAIVSAYLYARIKRIDFLNLGDALSPAFLAGAGITRIGCFLNGCCFGRPTDGLLGVVFPAKSPAGMVFKGTHLHPTQLYASILGFAFFGLVLYLQRFGRFKGYTLSLVLGLYALDRLFVDLFRYYEENQVLFRIGNAPFSVNELVILGLFIASVSWLITGFARSKK